MLGYSNNKNTQLVMTPFENNNTKVNCVKDNHCEEFISKYRLCRN